MDPLLSYYSVYLGLGIGMILMTAISCWYYSMLCDGPFFLSHFSVDIGLGIGMILMTAILCCYYNMILGWALYYLGNSFR